MAEGTADSYRIEITGSDALLLQTMEEDLETPAREVVLNALHLYKTLLDWKAKGNHIDMVTPARGESRDELQLP